MNEDIKPAARMSIKHKLVLLTLTVSLAAMLLAGGAFITFQWVTFRQRMVHDLRAQAEMVGENCTAALSFDVPEDAVEVMSSLKAKPPIAYACVFRSDKSILAEYRRSGYQRTEPPPFPSKPAHTFYNRWLTMSREVRLNDRSIGTVYLQSDLSELDDFITNSTFALGVVTMLALLAAYFLSARLQKLISGPISHLSKTAADISTRQDYSVRAVKKSNDEFGRLTDAFNNMLGQVEKRDRDLDKLRNLLSNIVNSMPSVLVGVDPGGTVTQWNHEAEKTTGVTAADALGKNLRQVYPQLAAEMKRVRTAIKKRQPLKNEKIARKVNGEPRYSDITVYPLVANGVEGAVIRVDDVTDRIRIEEMMIQSEKMLSVGGLAAGMAHEINNPLAGILQNIQVMRNRLQCSLPKNTRTAESLGTSMDTIKAYMDQRGIMEMIEAIMASGGRAAQIVENMLSFSRLGEARPRPNNLAALLDKTVELASNDYDLKKKYDFRKIRICREYDPAVPPVLCEAGKIQQVFLNLLKNGAHAMAEWRTKGKPKPRFTLRVKPDRGMVHIEIEDNGPGMDESLMKRIFEPFFTTKGVGMGTGLGLSVSYFIITENHKGVMKVESPPGKGANFIIKLPVKR